MKLCYGFLFVLFLGIKFMSILSGLAVLVGFSVLIVFLLAVRDLMRGHI